MVVSAWRGRVVANPATIVASHRQAATSGAVDVRDVPDRWIMEPQSIPLSDHADWGSQAGSVFGTPEATGGSTSIPDR